MISDFGHAAAEDALENALEVDLSVAINDWLQTPAERAIDACDQKDRDFLGEF